MALDSSNVRVAVTGTVSVEGTSPVAPTDADSALSGFEDLGYISDDGVAETIDRTTEKIKAWQGAAVVRTVVTESSATWHFKCIESKKEVIEAYYAAAVDTGDGSVIVDPSLTGGRKKWVIDVVDDDQFIRTYVPQGEFSDSPGEVKLASGEAIGYDFTITGYPDVALGGTFQKFYSALAS